MRHFLKRKDILQLSDSFISSNCIQGAKSVKQKIVYLEICFLQDYFQQQELEDKGKISQWSMLNKLECVYFVLVKISAYESFGFCPVWCACLYYHHSISGGRNQGVQDKHELYNVLQASLGYITSKVSKYMIITQTCFKSKEEIIPILQSSGFQHLINFPPRNISNVWRHLQVSQQEQQDSVYSGLQQMARMLTHLPQCIKQFPAAKHYSVWQVNFVKPGNLQIQTSFVFKFLSLVFRIDGMASISQDQGRARIS